MKQTLKSTKQYRVKLFPGSDKLAGDLAILAMKSNGGQWVSIAQLQSIVDSEKLLYPSIYKGYTAELIGDKTLHLDIPAGGGEYKTILSIEEVDILESDFEVEDSDFEGLGGLAD